MSYPQSQSDACRPINGLTTEEFLLYSIRCLSERMKEHTIQLAAHARLQALSTSRDTDAPGTESGLSDPASWRMETDDPIGTMKMELGDPTDLERLLKILPNHLQAENIQPGQIIYLPQGETDMVATFRPIERIMDNRYDRMVRRMERQLRAEGRANDANLLAKIQENDEAMQMMRQEMTVAFARAEGVEVTAFGDQSRPFLDFIGKLFDAQFFRKFVEWAWENREMFMDLAKMIAAIIGIFA